MTDTLRLSVGAKANAAQKGILDRAIRDAIEELLQKHSLAPENIEQILASGMLTSEMGLYSIPHIEAPAGLPELHAALTRVTLPEISSVPFSFVTGVKTVGTLEGTDLMRGEETELYGLFDTPPKGAAVILPGSHSKVIRTDDAGRISSFETMLTGEMLASLSSGTVLSESITLSEGELDAESLLDGYRYTEMHGLNAALFKVRVLRLSLGASHNQAYSFFLGAVLHDEVKSVIRANPSAAYIGGRRQIKEATALLLSSLSSLTVVSISDEAVNESTAKGLVKIYEYSV